MASRRTKLSALRKGLYAAYAIGAGMVCFICLGVAVLVTPGQTRRRRIARFGVRAVFFAAGIPLKIDGLSHLPDGPCVVVANHRSYLDGPALIAALPPRFTPIIKAEIAQVPVVAAILRRSGARFVRRTPVMKAGRDTAAMLDGLQRGESLALFPEGTFSVDDGLLPFREGAFFLAAKSGCPVVPVTIEGTQAVLPLGHYIPRFATVHVEISAPLSATGQRRPASRELRGRTETALWEELRPASAGTRQALEGYRYYRRVFRGCEPPFGYLDLDRLTPRLRLALEQSRGKRLRVDGRVLGNPAIIDRVLRSDIRLDGVLCGSVSQAAHLASSWRLRDLVVATPVTGEAELLRVCDAIAHGCDICLNIDTAADIEVVAEVAQRCGVEVPVCVTLGTSVAGGGVSSSAVADLMSLLEVIETYPGISFRGVIEQQRAGAEARPGATERARRIIREGLKVRGYARPLYSICDTRDLAADGSDPAVSEIIIGRELFAPESSDQDGWPVAGYVLGPQVDAEAPESMDLDASDVSSTAPAGIGKPVAATPAEGDKSPERRFFAAPDTAALDMHFSRLYLVQGGALVSRIATSKAVGPAGVRPPDRRRRLRRRRR